MAMMSAAESSSVIIRRLNRTMASIQSVCQDWKEGTNNQRWTNKSKNEADDKSSMEENRVSRRHFEFSSSVDAGGGIGAGPCESIGERSGADSE